MPPSQFTARVSKHRTLTGGYFILEMQTERASAGVVAPLHGLTPGQFVMIRGAWGQELLNPRAFSVLWADDEGRFAVMLKVYGRGTARLHASAPGDPITVTGPLGQGFPEPGADETRQLLVAGGVGLPPLHLQARLAAELGRADAVEVLYGGRNSEDLVLLEDFERWGVQVTLATEDGSVGTRGFVTAPLAERLRRVESAPTSVEVLACGPTPMLRAVRELGLSRGVRTLLCLEEEMACGFGVCLGCAVPVYGPKPYRYCCTDGPVFDAKEVRWS